MNTLHPSDDIRQSAGALIVRAWNCYDEALDTAESSSSADPLQPLLSAVDFGIQAMSVLYSGAAGAPADPEVLRHLLAHDPVFKTIGVDYIALYGFWKDRPPEPRSAKGRLTPEFRRFLEKTDELMMAMETWYFERLRDIYCTWEQDPVLKKKKKRLLWAAAGLILMLLALFPLYKFKNQIQQFTTKGQFFFLAHKGEKFTEENSVRFEVKADGRFHDYELYIQQPIDFVTIRFDPVDEPGPMVWIDRIEFQRQNEPPLIYDFNRDREYWSPVRDIAALSIREGCLYFETQGKDPILAKGGLSVKNLSHIKVRMKVTFYKNYIQWLFS